MSRTIMFDTVNGVLFKGIRSFVDFSGHFSISGA